MGTERCRCDRSEWQVSQCTCGQLTLKLGPLRVEFTAREFAQLHRLVSKAMTELQISPATGCVAEDTPTIRH